MRDAENNEFVLRGTFDIDAQATTVQVMIDDGLQNLGYRVKEFKVLPNFFQGQTVFCGATSMLSTVRTPIQWNLEQDNQLGWMTWDDHGYAHWEDVNSLVDDTIIFNRELYLHCWNSRQSDSATYHLSYFIRLERVALDDNQAVLILANEVNR